MILVYVEFLVAKCENSSYNSANIHKNASAHTRSIARTYSSYVATNEACYTIPSSHHFEFISFLVFIIAAFSYVLYDILCWLGRYISSKKGHLQCNDECMHINCVAVVLFGGGFGAQQIGL